MSAAGSGLEHLLDDAASDLQRLSGGAAVCTFTRSGRAVPGIKYAEGRWAALREVHRGTSSGGQQNARETLAAWQRQLDAVVARGAGADWVAYRTGGVDALHDLIASDIEGTR
ncbi:MAG: hypothetical protein LCI03_05220 [Actinobacteria bacterium]|jgi:hypothetical protein|nr:hypothetical protein [Actinomycetota bacterium]